MAGDKKQNQDDWDNLPLDPDAADDWDDIPPPSMEKAPAPSASAAPEKADPAESSFETPPTRLPNRESDNPAIPDVELPPPEPPADGPAEPPADDFEANPAEPDDFESPSYDADGFDEPDTAEGAAAAEAAQDAPPEEEEEDGPGPEVAAPAVDDEIIPLPNVSEPKPPTKKVELDIEGMIFQEDQAPAGETGGEADEEEAPEEPPAAALAEEPGAEAEPPKKRRRAKLKLLIIIVPALLILLGLAFGAYKLFGPSAKDVPAPPPPIISPDLPARDPGPGEMPLDSFYINFPGRPSDTIIELSIVLHYNDGPDESLIRDNLVTLRDIIYRVTQGKGGLVITDNELQRALREELRERINAVLGGERVSYVQINQIRILQ